MTIGEIVLRKGGDLLTIPPSESLPSAARIMSEKRIGVVLVVGESGNFVGVLSERDVVKAVASQPRKVAKLKVDDLVTKNVTACSPHTPTEDALATMKKGQFRHMPVVNQGKLVGLVSIGDILQHMARESRLDRDALEVVLGENAF